MSSIRTSVKNSWRTLKGELGISTIGPTVLVNRWTTTGNNSEDHVPVQVGCIFMDSIY